MPLNAHPIYIYINHGKTDATFSDMMRIATQKKSTEKLENVQVCRDESTKITMLA